MTTVTRMLSVTIQWDLTLVHATPDTVETEEIAQVKTVA